MEFTCLFRVCYPEKDQDLFTDARSLHIIASYHNMKIWGETQYRLLVGGSFYVMSTCVSLAWCICRNYLAQGRNPGTP